MYSIQNNKDSAELQVCKYKALKVIDEKLQIRVVKWSLLNTTEEGELLM